MTKEQLAAKLDGREYGNEITDAEEKQAQASGLVVVFGYSDDNVEFRGCIVDEYGCYGGGSVLVTKDGLVASDHDCNCDCCGHAALVKRSKQIDAVWDYDGYSWIYKTDIPHATFEILEDGEKYCRGIVFEMASLT